MFQSEMPYIALSASERKGHATLILRRRPARPIVRHLIFYFISNREIIATRQFPPIHFSLKRTSSWESSSMMVY
jgi:hypothetical protein